MTSFGDHRGLDWVVVDVAGSVVVFGVGLLFERDGVRSGSGFASFPGVSRGRRGGETGGHVLRKD